MRGATVKIKNCKENLLVKSTGTGSHSQTIRVSFNNIFSSQHTALPELFTDCQIKFKNYFGIFSRLSQPPAERHMCLFTIH